MFIANYKKLFVMKILSIVLLCILSLAGIAQPKVLLKKEVSEKELIQLYSRFPQQGVQENRKQLFSHINSLLTSVLPADPKPGILLTTHLFVTQKGQVEHLLIDLENTKGYNLDSLGRVVKEALLKGLTGWEMSGGPVGPFSATISRFFGKLSVRRDVRKTDSSATDLKMALAVIDSAKIRMLFLNQLDLKSVPDVIYRFPELRELYLGGNQLKSASIDMARLPKLKQLDLHGNQLTNNSLTITRNKTLEILNLKENLFTDIPVSATKCRNLQMLWLGGNSLSALRNGSFRKLKSVKDLNFYKSDIATLPGGIKKMKNLMVLDLYYNKLTALPQSVVRLRNLTQLAVSYNELTDLPRKIDKLKKLHTLFAHHNNLSKLPENIGQLRDMRILDLGYNWYTDFPKEIISFDKLEELDLSSNNFLKFPAELLEIKYLGKLYLRGNPFLTDNTEVKYADQLGSLKSKNIEVFY
jgi:Leucine-rich repeat (LRR) protein